MVKVINFMICILHHNYLYWGEIKSLLCFWSLAEYLIVMRAMLSTPTVAYTLPSATHIPDLSNIIFKTAFM